MPDTDSSPFAIPNIRWFVAFRVFFNSRFYYPVFTILFLDYGLTLEQFALLNAVWAATIVLAEVPSGALADTVGRRKLVILAAVLMIVEMVVLCVVPLRYPGLVFTAFLVNRVLSGLAEAAASGADEALAYDSLQAAGRAQDWGRVLEWQVRLQSIGFIVAMIVGAAVYDPELIHRFSGLLGVAGGLDQQTTMRFPVILTAATALLALWAALRLDEGPVRPPEDDACPAAEGCVASTAEAFRKTLSAGAWILATPFAFMVIFSGLLFDGVLRMMVTLASEYYRTIQIPEALFGVIGAGLAMMGLVVPRLGRFLVERWSPTANFGWLVMGTLVGLAGAGLFIPVAGVAPVAVLVGVMYLNGFCVSHYLNRITSSDQRATVLSFRGLAFNLAYGLMGLFYSVLLAVLKGRIGPGLVEAAPVALDTAAFVASIRWFPVGFLAAVAVLIVIGRLRLCRTAASDGPDISGTQNQRG